MSRKTLESLVAMLCLLLCLGVPPAASQEEEASESVVIEGTRFTVTLEAHEIPQFIVVEHFFRRIAMVRDHSHIYEKLLQDIGIKPGSETARFLADITDTAIEILNVNSIDGSLTGEAFMEHQYKAVGEKARKLGIVYRNLLRGLEEAGSSSKLVEKYCEEILRPDVTVFSTERDERYFVAVAEFEKQLAKLQ